MPNVTNICTNPNATIVVNNDVANPIASGNTRENVSAPITVTITTTDGSKPSGLYFKVPFTLNTDSQFTIPLTSSSGPINVSIGDGQG